MPSPRRRIALIAAAMLLPAAGRADTLTRTISQTVNYSGTGPIEDFSGIALFNPDLGTLNSVTQTLSGNLTFTPNSASSYFTVGVNGPETPITSLLTFTTGGNINVSVTSGPTLEELTSQFGQQYIIEPFDISIFDGTLVSNGLFTDSFTFNYTPAAVTTATPEPSSFALLGSGLLGMAGLLKRRFSKTA